MSKKIYLLAVFLFLTAVLSGCGLKATDQNQNNQDDSQAQIANPASQYCLEQGGQLIINTKVIDGKEAGQFGVCMFEDNRQCEEWAFLHGYCPAGGKKITGYITEAARYCAIIGGEYVITSQQSENKEEQGICKFENGAECDVWRLYEGDCRQHFNEPAVNWQYQKYADNKLLIGGPQDVEIITAKNSTSTADLKLFIQVKKISDLPQTAPLGMGRDTAEKDMAALAQGNYGETIDFSPVESSKEVVKNSDGIYIKKSMILGRFEVCDVAFDQQAIFYYNSYQIIITLIGNKEKIIAENPGYFGVDSQNCGETKIWNYQSDDKIQNKFYEALKKGEISGAAGNWYNIFPVIIDGIALAPAEASADNL